MTRIGEEQPGGWAYHLSDALGSVRQLADGSAQVTLAQGYMPYGERLWSVGNGSSAYGYTGEDWNVTTQLLFLRARYMQPELGMFLSRDPWSGDDLRLGSMHGWNYVEGNPVNRTDPSGKSFICFINPIGLLICVLVIGGMIISSGCTTPENACRPLPANLEPNAIGDLQQALRDIQDNFDIKLPPHTTTKDNKQADYRFVYAKSMFGLSPWEDPLGAAGYTPWFDQKDWGQVYIYQLTFDLFRYNAYDIAGIMVHEAIHAWQQYSIAERVKKDNTFWANNLKYNTTAWEQRYGAAMEVEAYQRALDASPRICLSQGAKTVLLERRDKWARLEQPRIPGTDSVSVPLIGSPLQ